MPSDHYHTALLIRWLHVFGMSLALGGAVLTWAALRTLAADAVTDGPGGDAPAGGHGTTQIQTVLALAGSYEWLFWAAVGVLVMSGVGNVGAIGGGLPGPGTRWGLTLWVKLAFVLGLVVLSLVRSVIVVRCRVAPPDVLERGVTDRLRRSYGATALYLGGLLVLAVVLAHG